MSTVVAIIWIWCGVHSALWLHFAWIDQTNISRENFLKSLYQYRVWMVILALIVFLIGPLGVLLTLTISLMLAIDSHTNGIILFFKLIGWPFRPFWGFFSLPLFPNRIQPEDSPE